MSKFSGRKNASVAANDTSYELEPSEALKQNPDNAFVHSLIRSFGGVAFPPSKMNQQNAAVFLAV